MNDRIELLALCVDRRGFVRGALLAEFITEWELAVRSHGGPVGVEEFAHWWKDSPSTAYRRLRDFRKTFPELGEQGTPNDLLGPLLAALRAGSDLPEGVMVEVPT